jgi:hypothetical protein
MSERAIAFVEEWVSKHVGAEDDSAAGAFAVQCAISANEAGIPDSELNDAFPSLVAVMSAAFIKVAQADASRDKSKDN